MSVLSAQSIVKYVNEGRLGISPFDPEAVQGASYDFRLGSWWGELALKDSSTLTLADAPKKMVTTQFNANKVQLLPQASLIAQSYEFFKFPFDLMGIVKAKSTIGKLGLSIVGDAGLFDPGFVGFAVLQIINHSPWTIELLKGMPIGQMVFLRLDEPVEVGYQGGYQFQFSLALPRFVNKVGQLAQSALAWQEEKEEKKEKVRQEGVPQGTKSSLGNPKSSSLPSP